MQSDIKQLHTGESHGQHQRNRESHHQTSPETEREKTDQQYDNHRFCQHFHKFVNTAFDCHRLVGDFLQLHAEWQGFLQAGEFLFQIFTQGNDVPTLAHRYSNTNAVFTHKAHSRLCRITKATIDFCDISQLNSFAIDQQRHLS